MAVSLSALEYKTLPTRNSKTDKQIIAQHKTYVTIKAFALRFGSFACGYGYPDCGYPFASIPIGFYPAVPQFEWGGVLPPPCNARVPILKLRTDTPS